MGIQVEAYLWKFLNVEGLELCGTGYLKEIWRKLS
jgi:hypothetical protein